MALPIAALAIKGATVLLSSATFREMAVDAAFNLGGKALNRMMPNLGAETGVADKLIPTLATLPLQGVTNVTNAPAVDPVPNQKPPLEELVSELTAGLWPNR